ncbi:MAG: response regulator [Bdellovibrio sp.]|jgi:CheY-like chemotaxis protein
MKFLIIDDEPLVRRSLARALVTKSHEVNEALDGQEGLTKWRALRPDVVFLDVLMPGLTGPQVLMELEQELKQVTTIILISAFSGDHNPETAQRLGADLFVPKPFEDIFALVKIAEELRLSGIKHGAEKKTVRN